MTTLAGKKVLLIEDEMLIAMMAEDILDEMGAEVVGPACSLSQGWDLSEKNQFEFALLDRNLNGEMSDELAQHLHERGIGVVVATGYGRQGLDLNEEIPVIGKPYSAALLEGAFRQVASN